MEKPELTAGEFALFQTYVRETTTIDLDASKRYLIETRIGPLLAKHNCASYAAFYRLCKDDKSLTMQGILTDAITTNETYFFRDQKPFDLMRHKLLPDLLGTDTHRPIDILSAACSSGQEAYSLAIIFKELLFDLTHSAVKITGIDISDSVVSIASKGEYSTFEVGRGLSPGQLTRYFSQNAGRFKIKDELRSICTFKKANLFIDHKQLGKYHGIFCRNVAIYFNDDMKRQLFNTLADHLLPGGFLIIGSTESLLGITDRFKRMEFHGTTYYM